MGERIRTNLPNQRHGQDSEDVGRSKTREKRLLEQQESDDLQQLEPFAEVLLYRRYDEFCQDTIALSVHGKSDSRMDKNDGKVRGEMDQGFFYVK